MQLVSVFTLARRAHESWKRAYFVNGKWTSKKREETYEHLRVAKTPGEVEKVLGDKTWVSLYCDSCEQRVAYAVQLSTGCCSGTYCSQCLRIALERLYEMTPEMEDLEFTRTIFHE